MFSLVTLTLTAIVTDMKVSHFEMIFIRFLHLLAHHPDFAVEEEQIRGMAK